MSYNFQKLESPQLVELDSELVFVIVSEVDLTEMKNGLIFMKGKSFNYEDGNLESQEDKVIQYSTNEDTYYEVDSQGAIID